MSLHSSRLLAFGRVLSVVLVVGFAPFTPAASAANRLQPANTYAVIIGLVRWQDPKVPTYSPRHRKDLELYQTLVRCGVPARNMALLLDKQATLANIRRSLAKVAAQARSGSTFLFYYTGHGARLPDGEVDFLNYDCDPNRLRVSELVGILRQRFKGARVLLMADCCHSGGLTAVARKLAGAGIRAASVTSAQASNASTGSWTFTQAVIDVLRGEPLADANGDGVITLGELNREVTSAMKYREKQLSGCSYHGVGPDFSLVRARKRLRQMKGRFRLGAYIEAPDAGKTRPARVVGRAGKAYSVEFYDYSDKRVVTLGVGQLKKISFKTYPVGRRLRAKRDGKLYAVRVLAIKQGFHLITYAGHDRQWDEWVLDDRLVPNPR